VSLSEKWQLVCGGCWDFKLRSGWRIRVMNKQIWSPPEWRIYLCDEKLTTILAQPFDPVPDGDVAREAAERIIIAMQEVGL